MGPSQDFIMGVYTQLSQIQRDLGSIGTAQKMLNEQVQASEVRISTSIKAAEDRTGQRLSLAEDKLSSLKDRINRVLWMGAGIGLVVGLLVGWKPIFTHLSTFMSEKVDVLAAGQFRGPSARARRKWIMERIHSDLM